MSEDPRLAAIREWEKLHPGEDDAKLLLAMIDAEDARWGPVTEAEVSDFREHVMGESHHQLRREVTDAYTAALTAFLTARRSAPLDARPVVPTVTDEMVERFDQEWFAGDWPYGSADELETRRKAVRRAFVAALTPPDERPTSAATIQPVETPLTGQFVEVGPEPVQRRLDALDACGKSLETRLADALDRIAALEARPAWTEAKEALLRHTAFVARGNTDLQRQGDALHASIDAAFPPKEASHGG